MLDRIPHWKFREWKEYAKLERFGEDREDARMAQLEATIWNIVRNTKNYPQPFKFEAYLHSFLVDMGEREKRRQTDDEKFDILTGILQAAAEAHAGQVIQRAKVQQPTQPIAT